jgi:hypothetical protein
MNFLTQHRKLTFSAQKHMGPFVIDSRRSSSSLPPPREQHGGVAGATCGHGGGGAAPCAMRRGGRWCGREGEGAGGWG